MSEKKGFFKENFGKTSEQTDMLFEESIMNKMQRSLESAYDNACDLLVKYESQILADRLNFKNFDVNSIIKKQLEIELLQKQKEAVKKEYKHMFIEDNPRFNR